ncbi:protein phosphatase 2C domain-containing protein [Deltaproteobacteria bacterium]|nr:protein phosphatase 2C domain-containing protein [Deltaproteobacteria bacterium]
MKIKVAGKSHIGMKRKLNEDSYLIRHDLGLYVVADGMGGHRAGEVASRMVIESMTDYWQKVNINEAPSMSESLKKDLSGIAKHLVNSLSFANTIVHEAQKQPQYLRMGSTVSALLVEGDLIWVANVGDSPVYILDQGHLRLISEEHSLEAEQKNMGFGDSFSSTNPLMKNMLTRVMGLYDTVEVFINPIRPDPGDIILVCSDGLTNYLPENDIKEILDDSSMSLEQKIDQLINGANRGGGGDNISVILLDIQEEGRWDRLKKRIKPG